MGRLLQTEQHFTAFQIAKRPAPKLLVGELYMQN